MNPKYPLIILLMISVFSLAFPGESAAKFVEFPEIKTAAAQLSELMKQESVSPDGTISPEMNAALRRFIFWGDKPPRQRLEGDLADWTKILSSLPGQLPEIGEFLKRRGGKIDDLTDPQVIIVHRMVGSLMAKLETYVRN